MIENHCGSYFAMLIIMSLYQLFYVCKNLKWDRLPLVMFNNALNGSFVFFINAAASLYINLKKVHFSC